MAADNQKQEAAAEMKKKVTIGAFVVIALIIAWQVIGLFGSSTPKPTVHPQALNSAKSSSTTMTTTSTSNSSMGKMTIDQASTTPRQVTVSPDVNLMKIQKEYEEKFISALNDLQMLKVQRDIEETRQAIAKAKLDTVTSNKAIENLVTAKPAVIPDSSYSNMMGGPGQLTIPSNMPSNIPIPKAGTAPTSTPAPTESAASSTYVVLSISQLNNKWSAVLGNGGKLYSVSTGDTLAVDNSIVQNINRDGVTLLKDGVKRKIPISSAV